MRVTIVIPMRKLNPFETRGLDDIIRILPSERSVSSRLSRNSEANASELRDNLEEMFPRY